MARKKKGLAIDGIINLDKPIGLSSNQALQKVKYLLNAQKAGHTGSLDPLASGVLPLCFGHATKVSSLLLDSDKGYIAGIHLGCRTTTGDREGDIIEPVSHQQIPHQHIITTLNRFLGIQQQLPPMHSAIKYQGQPLYKLARKGKQIEREPRKIQIYTIDLLEYQFPELLIKVVCSKGTYIRSLAEDIGTALNCGAHLFSLRRVKAGDFTIDSSYTLEQITDLIKKNKINSALNNIDSILQHLPQISLSQQLAEDIRFGRKILVEVKTGSAVKADRTDCLFTKDLSISQIADSQIRLYEQNDFLGLAQLQIESSSDKDFYLLQPKRLFC